MSNEDRFFFFLQYAIGRSASLPFSPTAEEWQELFDLCNKQKLLGIGWAGIVRGGLIAQLPLKLRIKWALVVEKIQKTNVEISLSADKVCRKFAKSGFRTCVLKGQSNMDRYPSELAEYRNPGDIDVWVLPQKGERPIRQVVEFCLARRPGQKASYHHVDFPILKTTEVEAHYRPQFLVSPICNRRLQRWFTEQAHTNLRLAEDSFPRPTVLFDGVFQLTHIFKHIFEEGIGLRQLMDYYWVLQLLSQDERVEIMRVLRSVHLDGFAGAVMYVLQQVFDLQTDRMLCPPDTEDGRWLLQEIMRAGNFGQFDPRMAEVANEGHAGRFWRKTCQSVVLARRFPHEALWQPYFMIYHYCWRKFRLWRWE